MITRIILVFSVLLLEEEAASKGSVIEFSSVRSQLLSSQLTATLPIGIIQENTKYHPREVSRFRLVHNLVHFAMEVSDTYSTAGPNPIDGIKLHAQFNEPSLAGAKIEKLVASESAISGFGLEPISIGNRHGASIIYSAYLIIPKGDDQNS